MESILITGASGFIGSFIVEEALNRSFQTWAGVRSSSSKKYLCNPLIHFQELDFSHPDRLKAQLQAHKDIEGKFDYVVHLAGVTKCIDKKDFERVNYLQTRCFIETLKALDMVPKQFIYMSSLSVCGPLHESDYLPIDDNDVPQPNTAYGVSKWKSEQYICNESGLNYVIFRPTGVYGPREKDYYLMAKSIRSHIDFAVGYKQQDLTFIYVKDLVNAVFLAIDKQVSGKMYFLTDGEVYQSRAFSNFIQKELGNPFVIHLKCPLFILKIVSLSAEFIAKCSKKSSTLNADKYKIMKQRNWRCDISSAKKELGYLPKYQLEKGVHETIAWYLKEGWL